MNAQESQDLTEQTKKTPNARSAARPVSFPASYGQIHVFPSAGFAQASDSMRKPSRFLDLPEFFQLLSALFGRRLSCRLKAAGQTSDEHRHSAQQAG
jgi:hypothetical protein